MDSLAIGPLFPVVDGVFVSGQHLLLPRHLRVPPLYGLGLWHAIVPEGRAHCVDDLVDGAEAFPLPCLLRARQTPGDLPVKCVI